MWPCSLKAIYLFHRTSCNNFCLREYCVKCLKALTELPFFHGECFNLTISQQRFQIFIYSKCFRRATVDISTFKDEFRSSCFLLIWQFHKNNCSYSLSIVYTCKCDFRKSTVLSGHCRLFSKHHFHSSIFLK